MKSLIRTGIDSAIIFAVILCSGTRAQELPEAETQSRVWLYGEVHPGKITGSFGELIDKTAVTTNQRVVYGLGLHVAYFIHKNLSVGPVVESTWWNHDSNLRGTTIGISGRLFMKDPVVTTPYVSAQAGVMSVDIQELYRGPGSDDESHWFHRIGLGFSFSRQSSNPTYLELFYKAVDIDMYAPYFVRRVVGRSPTLTYVGIEFGFGIPL